MMGISTKRNKFFFSNIVVAISIVLVWRGVRHLADEYLFPNYSTLSSIISLLVGIVLLYFVDGDLSLLGGVEEEEQPIFNRKSRDMWIILTTICITLGVVVGFYLLVQ